MPKSPDAVRGEQLSDLAGYIERIDAKLVDNYSGSSTTTVSVRGRELTSYEQTLIENEYTDVGWYDVTVTETSVGDQLGDKILKYWTYEVELTESAG
jgi:hypothetical protein